MKTLRNLSIGGIGLAAGALAGIHDIRRVVIFLPTAAPIERN